MCPDSKIAKRWIKSKCTNSGGKVLEQKRASMTKTLNPMAIGLDLYICEGQSGLRVLLGESSSP